MPDATTQVLNRPPRLDEGAQECPGEGAEVCPGLAAPLGQTGGVRILVADDDDGVRGFLRTVLERAGYQTLMAANGREAFRLAIAWEADLVITDLVMPEQEGIETIRALRRIAPALGIIAMSGAFEGQFLEVARRMGAHAALPKPVSVVMLLRQVEEVLSRPK
ncbi:MAG TPA: response regulator [Bryobacteraceae bacterium]|nr:response regulator [Bryobacteraceae bacterium]